MAPSLGNGHTRSPAQPLPLTADSLSFDYPGSASAFTPSGLPWCEPQGPVAFSLPFRSPAGSFEAYRCCLIEARSLPFCTGISTPAHSEAAMLDPMAQPPDHQRTARSASRSPSSRWEAGRRWCQWRPSYGQQFVAATARDQ